MERVEVEFRESCAITRTEQLEVQFLLPRLNPLRNEVFDEIQVLLLYVRKRAVGQILQKDWGDPIYARHFSYLEKARLGHLRFIWIYADWFELMPCRHDHYVSTLSVCVSHRLLDVCRRPGCCCW
ncbi:hypothetical protein D3C87_1258120 [compost metagenome]